MKIFSFAALFILFSCGVQVIKDSSPTVGAGANFDDGSFTINGTTFGNGADGNFAYQWIFNFTDGNGNQVLGCTTTSQSPSVPLSSYSSTSPSQCSNYPLTNTHQDPTITPNGVFGPFTLNYCLLVTDLKTNEVINESGTCSTISTGSANPIISFDLLGFDVSNNYFPIDIGLNFHICSELTSSSLELRINGTLSETWNIDTPNDFTGSTWTPAGAYSEVRVSPGPQIEFDDGAFNPDSYEFRVNNSYTNPNCVDTTKALVMNFDAHLTTASVHEKQPTASSPDSIEFQAHYFNFTPFADIPIPGSNYINTVLEIENQSQEITTEFFTVTGLTNSSNLIGRYSGVFRDLNIYPKDCIFSGNRMYYLTPSGNLELLGGQGNPIVQNRFFWIFDYTPIPDTTHFTGNAISSVQLTSYDMVSGELAHDTIHASESRRYAPPSGVFQGRQIVNLTSSGGNFSGINDGCQKFFDFEIID